MEQAPGRQKRHAGAMLLSIHLCLVPNRHTCRRGACRGTSAERRTTKKQGTRPYKRPQGAYKVWWQQHEETPGPIPNPAVKPRRADGTASQDVGE